MFSLAWFLGDSGLQCSGASRLLSLSAAARSIRRQPLETEDSAACQLSHSYNALSLVLE